MFFYLCLSREFLKKLRLRFYCNSRCGHSNRLFWTEPSSIMSAFSSSSSIMVHNKDDSSTVKFLIHYQQQATVIYLPCNLTLESFYDQLSSICHLTITDPPTFTVKWLDESLDAITMSSQRELTTALRLYTKNADKELHIHIFPSRPDQPGLLCPGEDPLIYRRGARRWKKLYLINGHRYQAKRFSTTASCTVCNDRLWGLGRQGYKCLDCRVCVLRQMFDLQQSCLSLPRFSFINVVSSNCVSSVVQRRQARRRTIRKSWIRTDGMDPPTTGNPRLHRARYRMRIFKWMAAMRKLLDIGQRVPVWWMLVIRWVNKRCQIFMNLDHWNEPKVIASMHRIRGHNVEYRSVGSWPVSLEWFQWALHWRR